MDFGQAALLIFATFAITAWVSSLIPALDSRIKPVLAMAIAIGTTFLVANTVWAPENTVQGHSLDQLDSASLTLVGILLGSGAVVLDQTFKAIRNVGENQPSSDDELAE